MVGWHHKLSGHESEQAPGDSEGRGSLVCCSACGHKELDTPEQLNNNSVELKEQVTEDYTQCELDIYSSKM